MGRRNHQQHGAGVVAKGNKVARQVEAGSNKQERKRQAGGQKRLKDGRHWRYVDVVPQPDDAAVAGDQVVWPTDPPSQNAWNAFLAQTDPRRQKVAASGLVRALLTSRAKPEWLASEAEAKGEDGDAVPAAVTVEERVVQLAAWVQARLRPVLRRSSAVTGHHSDPSSDEDKSDDEEEQDSSPNGGDDGDGDEGNSDDHSIKTRTKSKSRKTNNKKLSVADAEWEVQIQALKLVSALSVLCGKDLPRSFVADAPMPTPPTSTGSRASQQSVHGGRPKRGRAGLDTRESAALADVLMSVIRTVKDDMKSMNLSSTPESELEEDERERRRSLRVEAMEALAVVCFIIDDARITQDACKFIAECYLEQRRKSEQAREEVDALWQSYDSPTEPDEADEGSDQGESESESEDEDKDESESDGDVGQENNESENDDGERYEEEHDEESSEPSEVEEDGESEEVEVGEEAQQTRQHRHASPAFDAAEQAQALRVWSFLLSLLVDDKTVRALVGPHKRSLVELILVEREDARNNVTGASQLRVQAAAALSILALSSSSEDESDGDDGDDDGSLDSGAMTSEDKRRLVALCMTMARARGGERVRGVARRTSEKNERTCFRRLVAQLIDSLGGGGGDDGTGEKDARVTSRKAKREQNGPEDYFQREKNRTSSSSSSSGRSLAGPRKVETHVVFKTSHAWAYFPTNSVTLTVGHLNELSGWRWRHVLGFLQHYFGSRFWAIFRAHGHVREATKILPPGIELGVWWEGQLKLLQVNKASLKGKSTQTKRYRRMTGRNPLQEDSYRQDKRGYVDQQSLTQWKRSIASEWRQTSNSYFAW